MGYTGLNSRWVNLVFFFWATIWEHSASYLFWFKSYTNNWKWNKSSGCNKQL